MLIKTYNKDFLEGHVPGDYGVLNSTIFVLDLSYKIRTRQSIKGELQTLTSKQLKDYDHGGTYKNGMEEPAEGNWSMIALEYNSANWFLDFKICITMAMKTLRNNFIMLI